MLINTLDFLEGKIVIKRKKMCTIYNDGTIASSTIHKQFTRLKTRNFELKVGECSDSLVVNGD